ncbi:MAG: response regulator [Acidobacteria bacterium]|nr:response regulator [Acidobacteriota bacterium]
MENSRNRTSELIAAMLRISGSLDPDTVLREIVESARTLTGVGMGLLTTVDRAGQVQDFITSGVAAEFRRQLIDWPDGPRLFEHLRNLPGPLRLRNLSAYVRSLGFHSDLIPPNTMLATPMRHRGEHVGTFFLSDKEGGREFTGEDEEVAMLFASQAATAIVNARTHRDERRTRADLEALIETSPVGVVVLDARTGQFVSVNHEARRIVEGLRTPGRPAEELLPVLTCHRADGRVVALGELPLVRHFNHPETVRAEEIVLSVPDGRSVRTLINATPIHSADGVESLVVTLQDLAPLEELERQRTEFLAMVSHELRAPLTSILGSTTALLRAAPGLDPAEVHEFHRIIDQHANRMLGLISELLDAGRIETGTLSVAPEPSDAAVLVDQARNTFLSGGGRHAVRIDLPPDLPRVMADRQRIVQVLNNLFSNAARHSPVSSPIRVAAARDGVHVGISVSDEGPGVPPDRLAHLFQKHAGVSGGERERGAAGTGLGLAICKGLVEAHGGRIWAESGGAGEGTRFTFTIPVADGAGSGTAADLVQDRSGSSQPGQAQKRILVVDDDPQMLRYARETLAGAGYAPVVTGDARELPVLIRTHTPELVLLDLLLPGPDGIELMQQVPELTDLPVIFISAYGRDETIARALETGAVDYIVKPFSPMELTARVRAALRRRADPETFVLGELTIDYDRRRVRVADRMLELTAIEYELLRVLSVNAGRVATHEVLLRQVWGARGPADTKRLRAAVKNLRAKLGDDAAEPAYIFNQRAVGYRMPHPGER